MFAASGGSSGDPLISLSYITDTFIPAMVSAMKGLISTNQKENKAEAVLTTVAVSAGGSITLSTGQTAVLTSGSASLAASRGCAVNATTGKEVTSGSMSLYSRYIVCEDSSVTIDILDDAYLAVSGYDSLKQGDGRVSPFTDVKRGSWYFDDVLGAYELGLVNGMTTTTYAPSGTLTVAQCIKLAACMHQYYHTGSVTLKNSPAGTAWYRSYVDYALENGIIDGEYDNYDAAIVRQEFVHVFYRAMPKSAYKSINSVSNGSIPDVSSGDVYADEIYTFYRAGILTGYSNTDGYAEHAFGMGATITRAEVATIINRMVDSSVRKSFNIS